MRPEHEIVKAYMANPVKGIDARIMSGDDDGVIFTGSINENEDVTVKVFSTGTISVSTTNVSNLFGSNALEHLKQTPDLYDIVLKAATDFKILQARMSGTGSFLFPELFACDENVVDGLIARWEKETGRNVYLTEKNKADLYRAFFMPAYGSTKISDPPEIKSDDITAWLREQNIQSIGRGSASVKVGEDGIEVEMSMVADGSPKDGMKRTKLELNSSVAVEAQLRAAVEIVCQEFNIG